MPKLPLTLRRFHRTTREAFAIDRACAIERFRPTWRQRLAAALRSDGENGLGIAFAIVVGIVAGVLIARCFP